MAVIDMLTLMALIVSVSSAAWSVWYNLNTERSSKIDRVIRLHEEFYSPDMLAARDDGWYIIDKAKEKDSPLVYNELWNHPDKEMRKAHDQMYKVMSFWLRVKHLGDSNKIDLDLARQLLGHDYWWWHEHLQEFVGTTQQNARSSSDVPATFQAFSSEGIAWLAS